MRRTSAFCAHIALFALVAGAFARVARAQPTDATWERLGGPMDPPPAFAHQVLRDPVRHRLLLLDSGPLDEIWEMPLPGAGPTAWQPLRIAGPGPAPRWAFSAAYDAQADRVIMFGGVAFDPLLEQNVYLHEVWQLSLAGSPQWTEIRPEGTSPAGRSGSAVAFDPVRDRLIVFGGDTDDAAKDETFSLELSGAPYWRHESPLGGHRPPGAAGSTAVYDPWNDRLVLFSGFGSTDIYGNGSAETWTLALAGQMRWHSLEVSPAPPVRRGSVVVLDEDRHELVVSGGTLDGAHSMSDTWVLDLIGARSWRQLPVAAPAPSTFGASGAYAPERHSLIEYGGYFDPYQSECDELALDEVQWSSLVPVEPHPSPSRRGRSTLIVDPLTDRLLVFGGVAWGCQHDLWAYALGDTSRWTQLPTTGIAPICGAENFVHDSRRHRLLAFGSDERPLLGRPFPDPWALSLDEPRVWTELHPSGQPPPTRAGFSVVYDSKRDRVLLFGGQVFGNLAVDSGDSQDDVWELSLGDSLRWRQLQPVGSPGARQEHAAVYDDVHDRMLVFQGEQSHGCSYYCATDLDDAWALSLAGDSLAWQPFGPDPPARGTPLLDPARDRLLLWSGGTSAWSLSLSAPSAWQELSLAGDPPLSRTLSGLTFDPMRDRMVLFGGYLDRRSASAGTFTSDIYALRFGVAQAPPIVPPAPAFALLGARPNPAVRDLGLVFSLLDDSPARLDVFDLAGRRVVGRDVGAMGPGRHELAMGRLAPGVYVVRLTQGTMMATRRAAVIR